MEEKRMVSDYTVLNSVEIGSKEILLCENSKAKEGERYLCCYAEQVLVYEKYTQSMVSDEYADIMRLFASRIKNEADKISGEILEETEKTGDNSEIKSDRCEPITYEDSLAEKVVVIRGDILRPEYKRATHQLMLCTGGSGSQPNPRSRTCYCINLYSGEKTSFYRSDVLGTIEPDKLPEWAKSGLEKAIRQNEKNKKSKQRGDAR